MIIIIITFFFCSKRESQNNSKIDHLKCVINAQPLLLEKCVSEKRDSTSMCYTVEFNNTDTILYGCTVTIQDRISMDSINCYNNLFKKCPAAINKARFSHRQLQYCCCNTTQCNGNYLHKREAKVSEEETNKNKSDIAMPEMKRAAVDFNLPRSASDPEIASRVSKPSWGVISGVICAAVVIACLVGAATIFINRRRRNHQAVLNANVGEMVAFQTSSDDSNNTEDFPGMICTPGRKSSVNVVHSDRTDTIVPAQLTLLEQNTLLHTIKQSGRLKAVVKGKKSPKITREPNGDLLMRLIRNGPKQFSFKFEEIRGILLQGAQIFLEEPTLLEVPLPCVVYGDIHGQYSDLHRWFNLNGWPSQVRSVFLGDFVDRGSHGIEVVLLLTTLKIRFPKNIFLCRGNHEEESLNRAYSFFEEVCVRFPENLDGKDGRALYPYFRTLFNNLPLAALIGGRILGMHGGISPKLTSLQAIREIQRPLEEFEVGSLECDLVWSDPDTSPNHTGFRNNFEREPLYGIGQLFASDTVQNAPLHGYALFSDGCMLTLFSAPGYKGSSNSDINMGASLEISTLMNITIKQIQVTEKFRQKRIADTEQRKASIREFSQPHVPVKSNKSSLQSTSSLFQ
uniref:protein-serine/threonine phosphatase n=1 Tax=Elaeophora elaphi TaxID=1147741 RepID=A0A0R3RWN5_9BILA